MVTTTIIHRGNSEFILQYETVLFNCFVNLHSFIGNSMDRLTPAQVSMEGTRLNDSEYLAAILEKGKIFVSLTNNKIWVNISSTLITPEDEHLSHFVNTYPSCSVYYLKIMLLRLISEQYPDYNLGNLKLHYNDKLLKDEKCLSDYNMNSMLGSASTQPMTGARIATNMTKSEAVYELTLVFVKKEKEGIFKIGKLFNRVLWYRFSWWFIDDSFDVDGLDFTFNKIKDVQRVNWSEEAPRYWEIQDGMCWLCYCFNDKCKAYNQLFVINRGYGKFKLSEESKNVFEWVVCFSNQIIVKNIGFVHSEWTVRGVLKRRGNNNSVSFNGKR